jgi:tetratricopeptide (TPR) repeat protein
MVAEVCLGAGVKLADNVPLRLSAQQRKSFSALPLLAPLKAGESAETLVRTTLTRLDQETISLTEAVDVLLRALRSFPEIPAEPWAVEGTFELARLLEKAKCTTAAYECYRSVADHLQKNSTQDAWLESERLRPLLIEPERLWVHQARVAIALGNFITAERLLLRARDYRRRYPAAVAGLFQMYLACDEFARVESILLETSGNEELQSLCAAAYRQLGSLKSDPTRLNRLATPLLGDRHFLGPMAVEFYCVARTQGEDALAERSLAHLAKAVSSTWKACDLLVGDLGRRGYTDGGLELLARTIQASPEIGEFAIDTMGEMKLQPPRKVARGLLRDVEDRPKAQQAIYHHLAGVVYLLTGDHARAEAQFRAAIAANPAYQAPYLPLLDLQAGNAEAIAKILKTLEGHRPADYFMLHLRGRAQLGAHQQLEALKTLKASGQKDRTYLPTQLQLAKCFIALTRRTTREDQQAELTELAELAFKTAISLETGRFSTHRSLLKLYLDTSQRDKAFRLAVSMVRKFPSRIEAKALLGEVYLQNHRLDRAKIILNYIKAKAPEHPAVKRFSEAVRQASQPALPEVPVAPV